MTRLRLGILSLGLAAAAFQATAARAASLSFTGANGESITTKPDPVPSGSFGSLGLAGGDGEAAYVQVRGSDPENSAAAIGGAGGAGGPGGDVLPPNSFPYAGGPGGPGGAGGPAAAVAETHQAAGDTAATASAQGGAGGSGGAEGSPTVASFGVTATRNGAPGTGGSADAQASASAQGGAATAASDATGAGSAPASSSASALSETGAAGSTATSTAGGEAQATSLSESHGGSAPAESHASALSGAAAATATATSTSGGESHSVSEAQSLGAGALANAHSIGSGSVGAEATALAARGAAAESHALAHTFGASDALASAIARGGQAATYDQLPGTVTISADATSDQGNATAEVDATAGNGFPAVLINPQLVSGPVDPGTPGGSTTLVDTVHGSAAGTLSLIQRATGGLAGGGTGGTGHSELHAENTGGGALFAEALGYGGNGQIVPFPRMLTTYGGPGFASVVATDTHGAPVEAHAFAQGGIGAISLIGLTFGSAESHASARGLGSLIARADSESGSATNLAISDVAGSGAIPSARSTLSAQSALQGRLGLHAETRLHAPAGSDGALLPQNPGAAANLFAAPAAADLAVWLAGNPQGQDALADKSALALGSLAAGYGPVTGEFELDLAASSFAQGTHLGIAFLDPLDVDNRLSLLHLQLSVDGNAVFDESFSDSASALAALDDAVVDLGPLAAANDVLRHLALSFELDAPSGFAADFVVFAPEPSAGGACGVALALLAVVRARSGHWRGGRDSNPQLPA